MAVTIGYYRPKLSAEHKKSAWSMIFPKLDDLSRVYKVTNVCPDTKSPFFFSLSEHSPTYIQAGSYVLATSKRSWSGGGTREDMHREYVMPCIVITDETRILWLTVFSSQFELQNRHLHSYAERALACHDGKVMQRRTSIESGGLSGEGGIQRRFGKPWRGYLIYWQCTCLRWTFPG